ncbi:MAG: adenylate kinase family protein [Candidatus Dojkabacteria bacterium]|jgi:adenylate kinase
MQTTFLFHGPSGCGKDTQVDLLVEQYNFESIGTGEMLRKMLLENDSDAIEADKYVSQGKFVPNEIIYRMLPKWLDKYDPTKNWAFVSVVRDVGQIPLFDDLLEKKGRKLDKFVHFTLSEEAAIERMSLRWYCPKCAATYHDKYKPEKEKGYCTKCSAKLEKREDDQPEKIKERLKEYNRTIQPILEEYRKRGILIEVDASPSIDEIHKNVVKVLNL